MTMKRRIFISNTAMILFWLLILLGIGGVIVELFKSWYEKDVLPVLKEIMDKNLYKISCAKENKK